LLDEEGNRLAKVILLISGIKSA